MPKVLITAATLADKVGPYLPLLRDAGLEIVYPNPWDGQLLEADLFRELPGIKAVIAGSEPYTRKVLADARDLRVIARVGVGYDAVDVAAATERGIAVTITPGANHDAVAEHAFALLLSAAKNVAVSDHLMRAGQWKRDITIPLRGRTMGIVGLGRIGKAVALRALAFQMRVVAFELYPDNEFIARHGVKLTPLDKLFAEADFISLHAPLGPETKHMINQRTLGLMKGDAILLNTARGGLVCEPDLVEALRAKRIAGAALDVFEDEPLPKNHPLLKLENVVLTPHTAGTDWQSRMDMAVMAAESIVALSKGEWPAAQIVNPAIRERFRW
jgi:phosphoglycerate dehydrogenase-like enzyme